MAITYGLIRIEVTAVTEGGTTDGTEHQFYKTDEQSYPQRSKPDNYKPKRVPDAFKVYAVGTTSHKGGEQNMSE
jgi:hypothetical protein